MDLAEERGELPPALANEPELYEDLEGAWSAFEDLNRSRGYQDGRPRPIAWSEILAYLELRGIRCGEERDELVERVLVLDNAFLEKASKKG